MTALNKITRNSSVKKDFSGNYKGMRGGKWLFELKRLEIQEQVSIISSLRIDP